MKELSSKIKTLDAEVSKVEDESIALLNVPINLIPHVPEGVDDAEPEMRKFGRADRVQL